MENLFRVPDPLVDLARASLAIAHLEYPGIAQDHYLGFLDELAAAAIERRRNVPGILSAVDAINETIYGEFGFRGNVDDYFDPRNSFINDVLERRTGIPITLSVIYIEVARRLDVRLYGVGLPHHFVIKHSDRDGDIFIDPYNRGRLLDRAGCEAAIREIGGPEIKLDDRDFQRADSRYVVLRMLNNLRGIYIQSRQYRKLVGVLDLMLTLLPGGAESYKERGAAYQKLGEPHKAKQDFERYLLLRPRASDASEVRRWVTLLDRDRARLN